jgi:hypothetical protein
MEYEEAVRSLVSVIKSEMGIAASFDDGSPEWFSYPVKVAARPIEGGLKVMIYFEDDLRETIHTNLTSTDVAITAKTIAGKLKRS